MNANINTTAASINPSTVLEIVSTYRGILSQYDMMKPFPAEARESLERSLNFWQAVANLQAAKR